MADGDHLSSNNKHKHSRNANSCHLIEPSTGSLLSKVSGFCEELINMMQLGLFQIHLQGKRTIDLADVVVDGNLLARGISIIWPADAANSCLCMQISFSAAEQMRFAYAQGP